MGKVHIPEYGTGPKIEGLIERKFSDNPHIEGTLYGGEYRDFNENELKQIASLVAQALDSKKIVTVDGINIEPKRMELTSIGDPLVHIRPGAEVTFIVV